MVEVRKVRAETEQALAQALGRKPMMCVCVCVCVSPLDLHRMGNGHQPTLKPSSDSSLYGVPPFLLLLCVCVCVCVRNEKWCDRKKERTEGTYRSLGHAERWDRKVGWEARMESSQMVGGGRKAGDGRQPIPAQPSHAQPSLSPAMGGGATGRQSDGRRGTEGRGRDGRQPIPAQP